MGNFVLNWGILVVGLVLFYFGFLFIVQYARAYKRHVTSHGRFRYGKEYGTSWDRADTRRLSGTIIFWAILILVVIGLSLFFFTSLVKIGVPLLIGCTLSIAGILLHFFALIGGMGIAKQDVDTALSHMGEDDEDNQESSPL